MHSLSPFRAVRRTVLLSAVATVATAVLAEARISTAFPDSIDLPNGWRPEGVVVGRGSNVYVGSTLAVGALWHGDLRTGEGEILFPGGTGQVTVGLEHDQHDRIWAAGGPTGVGKVSTQTGSLLSRHTPSWLRARGSSMTWSSPLRPRTSPIPWAVSSSPCRSGPAVSFPIPEHRPARHRRRQPDRHRDHARQQGPHRGSAGDLYRVDPATGTTTEIDLGGENV